MKTLISMIAMPFRFIANSALSNMIVNLFKKAPWLTWLISLLIALAIIFVEYGM
jgi:hypothetical protein